MFRRAFPWSAPGGEKTSPRGPTGRLLWLRMPNGSNVLNLRSELSFHLIESAVYLIGIKWPDQFIQWRGWFEDQYYVYIVMEFADTRSLASYPVPCLESHAQSIIYQLLQNIKLLHTKEIAHGNIKPSVRRVPPRHMAKDSLNNSSSRTYL